MEATRSPFMRRFAIVAAALGWVALGIQLYLSLRMAHTNGKGLADGVVIYFSFFTVLTNIFVALAFSLPLMRAHSRVAEFFSRPTVNTAIAVSIALVGITYTMLLRHLWQPEGMQLVVDILLHDVMPVLFLLYWWLAVPKDLLRWADVLYWMLYPLVYLTYALLRGALSRVYPYPFIDAAQLGYTRVFLNALGNRWRLRSSQPRQALCRSRSMRCSVGCGPPELKGRRHDAIPFSALRT